MSDGDIWRRARLRITSQAAREFSWLSLTGQVEAVLGVSLSILVIRTLPESEAGQVFFAQSVAAVALMILDPRVEDTVQHFFPQLRGERRRSGNFFWLLVLLDALIGLCVFMVAYVATTPVESLGLLGQAFNPAYFLIAMATATIAAAVGTVNAGFAVTFQLEKLAKVRLALATLTFAVSATALWTAGAIAFLAAGAISAVVSLLVLTFMVARLIPASLPRRSELASVMPTGWFRFTIASSLATTVASGGDNATLAVAGTAGGPSVVVLLKIAQAPARFLLSVFSPISAQVFPRAAKRYSEGDLEGVVRLCTKASKTIALPVIVVVALALALLPLLIPILYGSSYSVAVAAAALFVLAAGIRAIVVWAKTLPLAIGRSGLRLATLGVETVLTLVGTWYLAMNLSAQSTAQGVGLINIGLALATAAFWWRFLNKLGTSTSGSNSPPT